MGILTPADYNALLRQDFCAFVQRCFYELNPQARFLWNWHIEVMAAKLAACYRGRIQFEAAWRSYCTNDVTPSQPRNIRHLRSV